MKGVTVFFILLTLGFMRPLEEKIDSQWTAYQRNAGTRAKLSSPRTGRVTRRYYRRVDLLGPVRRHRVVAVEI